MRRLVNTTELIICHYTVSKKERRFVGENDDGERDPRIAFSAILYFLGSAAILGFDCIFNQVLSQDSGSIVSRTLTKRQHE